MNREKTEKGFIIVCIPGIGIIDYDKEKDGRATDNTGDECQCQFTQP
jgi:hypothetical protein